MTATDRPARRERLALVDTLRQAGPDAPTLCEGWTTRDLAAHLVIREHRLDALPGILVPALAGHTETVQGRAAQRPYEDLLSTVAGGAAPFHPAAVPAVDEAMNAVEMFVHHEDVRRAGDATTRRELDPDLERALWATVGRMGGVLFRRAGVGVILHAPGYGRSVARRARGEEPTVVVRGAPGEIVLFGSGRDAVARVELEGPDEAVRTLRSSRRGL